MFPVTFLSSSHPIRFPCSHQSPCISSSSTTITFHGIKFVAFLFLLITQRPTSINWFILHQRAIHQPVSALTPLTDFDSSPSSVHLTLCCTLQTLLCPPYPPRAGPSGVADDVAVPQQIPGAKAKSAALARKTTHHENND